MSPSSLSGNWICRSLVVTICLSVFTKRICATDSYDYIIVGAGSAGSVLANRLSESGKFTVLLLEAGGRPVTLRKVPALTAAMYSTKNMYRSTAEPQHNMALGTIGQRIPWNHGKGLGGTSIVNYMVVTRGHRADYDRWAANGNPGWSFEEVLPYFKKFENSKLPFQDRRYRSVNGELDIGYVPYRSEGIYAIINATIEAGLDYMEDYNTGHPFGVSFLQGNLRKGRRCDSELAFLQPAYKRKNLEVKINSKVTKVLIDKDYNTATGVEFKHLGTTYHAYAKREVILSAGTLSSPQILMLSGIGPKKDLENLDIEVIIDLPVGKVVYDHISFLGLIFTLEKEITPMFRDLINPLQWTKFIVAGKGHLVVPAFVIEGIAFTKTSESNDTIEDYPDVEMLLVTGQLSTDYGLTFKREFRITDETYNTMYKPLEGKPVWTIFPFPYHPLSRGYIKLVSKDPEKYPKFYANYYTDPEGKDMRTMIAAIRIAQKIAESPSIKKYGSRQHFATAPGCKRYKQDSDEYWECQVRTVSGNFWHYVSTCKMGPKSDPEAVVDNHLRVYGINNLRVADLSVVPHPLSAHTHAPATMIGEKAAALILNDHVMDT